MSIRSLADCKKELGPTSTRTGDTSFTFASVDDVIKAKRFCANQSVLRDGLCGLQMCRVTTERPSCCAGGYRSRAFG